MRKIVVSLITISCLSSTMAYGGDVEAKATLNEYNSAIINLACIEKDGPALKECNVPIDKCKRFATLVAKNCLGQAILLSKRPKKHPRNMTEEELLTVIDEGGRCAGRSVPLMTYYVCPELHERSWAGSGSYDWPEDIKEAQ